MRALLGAGVAPDSADKHGIRALMCACGKDRPECAQALLDAGAELEDDSGPLRITALMMACVAASVRCVRLLLAAGANVTTRPGSRGHLSYVCDDRCACAAQKAECVRLLLAAGAEVNSVDRYGDSPLHDAVGVPECVGLLLAAGADVNAVGLRGLALGGACEARCAPSVRLLLAAGARVDVDSLLL